MCISGKVANFYGIEIKAISISKLCEYFECLHFTRICVCFIAFLRNIERVDFFWQFETVRMQINIRHEISADIPSINQERVKRKTHSRNV